MAVMTSLRPYVSLALGGVPGGPHPTGRKAAPPHKPLILD
jgi:hypothetical protein